MDVSKTSGTPKWMVYFMENPIKMDDLGGFPTPIFGSTPKWSYIYSLHHQLGDIQGPRFSNHRGNGAMADIIARSFDPPKRWVDMGKPSESRANLNLREGFPHFFAPEKQC